MSEASREVMLPEAIWHRVGHPGSATHLAFLRVVFSGYILFLYKGPYLLFMHSLGPIPFNRLTWSLMPAAVERFIADAGVPTLYALGIVSTSLVMIGLHTRASTVVSALCYILIYGVYYRFNKSHVEWIYVNTMFVVFCLAPCADRLSVDAWWRKRKGKPLESRPSQHYRWPVELLIGWVSLVYLSAGLCKIFPLRSMWIDGNVLHQIFGRYYFDSPVHWLFGRPAFDYNLHWPFAVGAILAAVLELSAVLMMLQRRWNVWIMVALIGMHVGIYIATGAIAFVYSALFCLALFTPPERFADFGVEPGGGEATDGRVARTNAGEPSAEQGPALSP